MSSYRDILDVGLMLFQARAQDYCQAYGLHQVETYTHSTQGLSTRFFCRYQLPGDDTEYESPAGANSAAAIINLRAALLHHLGPPISVQ
jgi:hypothetical protein